MYNRKHVDRITACLWREAQEEYERFYDVTLRYNWERHQDLADFLNLCLIKGRDDTLLYTLAKLRYEAI